MLDSIVPNIDLYMLIFVRIIVLINISPIFSSTQVSFLVKIALSLSLAILIKPYLPHQDITYNAWSFILLLLGEGLIGFIIGLFINIEYSVFRTSGQFFAIQMGLGIAQMFDPSENESMPIIGYIFNYMAVMVFFSTNIFFKFFLYGLGDSFKYLTVMNLVNIKDGFFDYFINAISMVFLDSLIMSFPIISTLLLISLSTGLMSKAAPQMNLLVIGFPITLLVGLIILFASISPIIDFMYTTMNKSYIYLLDLMHKLEVK